MIFGDSVAELCEYSLHPGSNLRNDEALWYAEWTSFLNTLGSQAQAQALRIAPQFPLLQRGIRRDQCIPLRVKGAPPERLEVTDNDPSANETRWTFEDDSKDLSYITETSIFDMSPKRTRSVALPSAQLDPPAASVLGDTSFDPEAASHLPTTLEGPLQKEELPTPSNASTQPADQNNDSSFYLDFALITISLDSNSSARNIYGQMIKFRNASVPIILEIKRAPPRVSDDSHQMFRFLIASLVWDAYRDINLKAPVVFKSFPRQKSIIGLAAIGPWWSFTVIRKGDEECTWSKTFIPDNATHDNIFRTLLTIADHHPDDPAHDEQLDQLLARWKRSTYNNQDAVAGQGPESG
ncbi:hypothetical protein FS749_000610 [Ceratobasidium sp. UAMH 11750]|nr:hypothetical protein FS749_000610 [Ceratobasidium sp. UAMH 11750]